MQVAVVKTHKLWSLSPSGHLVVAPLLLVDPHISHLEIKTSTFGNPSKVILARNEKDEKFHLAKFPKEICEVIFCAVVRKIPDKKLLRVTGAHDSVPEDETCNPKELGSVIRAGHALELQHFFSIGMNSKSFYIAPHFMTNSTCPCLLPFRTSQALPLVVQHFLG